MRKMVQTAERDRTDAVQKSEIIQQQQHTQHSPSPFTPDYQSQLERIGELERDHLRLTATQTLAEVRAELWLVLGQGSVQSSVCAIFNQFVKSPFCYHILFWGWRGGGGGGLQLERGQVFSSSFFKR